VTDPQVDELTYTDDAQMTIAVAAALIREGRADEATLCEEFVAHYQPGRGYGQGTRRIIEVMAGGGDWRTLAATMFPGGSLGNGAAMRAAPVGLLFHDDLDRVAFEAAASARPTHLHPIGIEGAVLIALSVALVTRDGTFDRDAFYGELLRHTMTDEFRYQLERAATWQPQDPVGMFGSSLPAHESVVTAIACFAAAPDSYTDLISGAIALGNDTDTLAAMAGCISGAYLGIKAVPENLLDRLEDGPKGRRHIASLANGLFERYLAESAAIQS
jgi:poly(ADP-ribose) glycohydrolase ARH3